MWLSEAQVLQNTYCDNKCSMDSCLNVDSTDLLLISPEIKEEVNDEFHQPLLHNCMILNEN